MKVYKNIYIKRRVLQLELDILDTISSSILSNTPKRVVLNNIKAMIKSLAVQIGLSYDECEAIYSNAYYKYTVLAKKTFNKADNKSIYLSIRASIMNDEQIKDANQVMYNYEFRTKHEYVYGQEGIIAQAKSPFFLASSHPNPAKGHAKYEGKMYYDRRWRSRNKYTEEEKESIRAYIKENDLHTIQWVVGPPVYLLTRRNCKHYFKNIPLDQVLSVPTRALLKKNKMFMNEKDEPVSDAILNYRKYYGRLKILEHLEETIPNPILEQDIANTKALLDKWRRLL